MRKVCFVFALAAISLFSFKTVNALSLNDDGSYMTNKGAKISAEQYEVLSTKMTDTSIDILSQKQLDYLSDAEKNILPEAIYSITTDISDKNGNIISSRTIPATREEALSVVENKNLHVLSDGKLHDTQKEIIPSGLRDEPAWMHSTSSKRVRLTYYMQDFDTGIVDYPVLIEAKWFTNPSVRSVDVLAVRWTTSRPLSNIIDDTFEAVQKCSSNNQSYTLDGNNMVRTTYGIGESMNLFDSCSNFELSMKFVAEQSLGTVYGTYQHATTGVLLSTSKSYSFGSSGLGGVLVYNPSSYANYYDGMGGVYDTLSTGCNFDCPW